MNYKHIDLMCPVTGKRAPHTFSDPARADWPFNACPLCHADQRSIGKSLSDLNAKRKAGGDGRQNH